MGTAFNTLLTFIFALVQFGLGLGDQQAPAVGSSVVETPALEPVPARIEFVDVFDEYADAVIWAIGLFEQADLPLPPLRFVSYGDDRTHCGGEYRGVHFVDGERSVIGLCTTDLDMVVEALIVHELSHAWAAFFLTDEREADFRGLRGYEYWRNHDDVAWADNGAEQAAEIMVWGLIDRPIPVWGIHDTGCDDLDAGYRALTGAAPLHGYRDHC